MKKYRYRTPSLSITGVFQTHSFEEACEKLVSKFKNYYIDDLTDSLIVLKKIKPTGSREIIWMSHSNEV